MKKISLRESLINIDKETDFEHNLTAMYESCSLTEDEKEKLVKYVDAYDIDSMNKMLNNKFTSDITTAEDAAMMESYFEDGDISDDELASILGGDTKYDIPDGIETPEETEARLNDGKHCPSCGKPYDKDGRCYNGDCEQYDPLSQYFDEPDEDDLDEKWEPEFSDEWRPEDIELWKSIDWKARNYEPYIDETKKIRGEVTAVGLPGGTRTGEAMFAKEFSANPIFTPKWKPITDPFEGQGTNGWYMYDGVDADDGYMMMTRTETQEVSDMLSETLDESKSIKEDGDEMPKWLNTLITRWEHNNGPSLQEIINDYCLITGNEMDSDAAIYKGEFPEDFIDWCRHRYDINESKSINEGIHRIYVDGELKDEIESNNPIHEVDSIAYKYKKLNGVKEVRVEYADGTTNTMQVESINESKSIKEEIGDNYSNNIEYCPSCGEYLDGSDISYEGDNWVRYTCYHCGNTFDRTKYYNESKSIKESANDLMIYLFPELTDEDLQVAKTYGLNFLGKNHGASGDEDNWVLRGAESSLRMFADKYLGYELHPDYLYDEEDFAGDIINESLMGLELDKDDILDWLAEHEQAWADAEMYFDDTPLEEVSVKEIVEWIADHEQLYDDFHRFFYEDNLDEEFLNFDFNQNPDDDVDGIIQ